LGWGFWYYFTNGIFSVCLLFDPITHGESIWRGKIVGVHSMAFNMVTTKFTSAWTLPMWFASSWVNPRCHQAIQPGAAISSSHPKFLIISIEAFLDIAIAALGRDLWRAVVIHPNRMPLVPRCCWLFGLPLVDAFVSPISLPTTTAPSVASLWSSRTYTEPLNFLMI
jgi:hypothetical protein